MLHVSFYISSLVVLVQRSNGRVRVMILCVFVWHLLELYINLFFTSHDYTKIQTIEQLNFECRVRAHRTQLSYLMMTGLRKLCLIK